MTKVIASLDSPLRTKAGVPLSRAYAHFVNNRIWVPGNDTWSVDAKILDGSLDTMDLGEYHRQRHITVPAGGRPGYGASMSRTPAATSSAVPS